MKKPRMSPKHYTLLILALGLISLWITVFAVNGIEHRLPRIEAKFREVDVKYGIAGIAVVSFLSATIIPFPGDAFFLAALRFSDLPALLFVVNLAMSTLGALTNFYLARILRKKWVEKHVDKEDLLVATDWFVRYGPAALIATGISLVPFFFDAMTFAIGLSNIKPGRFLKYCVAAKFLHYLVLALVTYKYISM